MKNGLTLIFFLMFVVASLSLNAKPGQSETQVIERLLKENRLRLRDLVEKRDELKKQESSFQDGKQTHESAFRYEMRTRLSALLHWPLLSFSLAEGYWIRREQDLLTLSVVRQRLVERPLENIRSTRSDLATVQEELKILEKEFERAKGRETILSLQAEELRDLKGKR